MSKLRWFGIVLNFWVDVFREFWILLPCILS
jgi:hypothetical protein